MNEESTIKEDGGLLMNRMNLPIEMLEMLFTFLPPGDLKTVTLVCKKWKEAASAPKLWTWVVFKLGNFDASKGVAATWFAMLMLKHVYPSSNLQG